MLDFRTATNPKTQIRATEQPAQLTLANVLREGTVEITPSLAARILTEAHFDGQRKVVEGQAQLYAEAMRRGVWLKNSQIAFCRVGSRYYLVNGRHRLTGVTLAKMPIEFQLAIYDCKSEAEVQAMYSRFDTMIRKRSHENVIHAFDLAGKAEVSKTIARAIYRAIPFIVNDMKSHKGYTDKAKAGLVDMRLDACLPWFDSARLLERCLEECDTTPKKLILRNGGTSAVALVTLRYQPEAAIEFWSGLAKNDGLRKGDPRHTLLNALLTRTLNSHHNGSVLVPALAWNAFFENRSLSIIKIYPNVLPQILGTPFSNRKKG